MKPAGIIFILQRRVMMADTNGTSLDALKREAGDLATAEDWNRLIEAIKSKLGLAGGDLSGKLTIDANESPSLHIVGDDPDVALDINSASPNNMVELRFQEGGTTKANVYWSKATDRLYLLHKAKNVTIDEGQLGIDTTAPNARLHINNGGILFTNTGDLPLLRFGTNASGIPNGDGFRMKYVPDFFGAGGTYDYLVFEKTDGNSNDPDGGIAFVNTGNDGLVEYAMVIKGDNKVAIGKQAPSYELDVQGRVASNGTVLSSDRRWKQNIKGVSHALETLSQLRGVEFEWDRTTFGNMNFPEGRHVGLVAQEVEEVMPQIVTTGEDGFKHIAYHELVPVLIEAVKELQAEIASLKNRLAEKEPEGSNGRRPHHSAP
jgi:hypothetical protein